jgi:hypothetical protein
VAKIILSDYDTAELIGDNERIIGACQSEYWHNPIKETVKIEVETLLFEESEFSFEPFHADIWRWKIVIHLGNLAEGAVPSVLQGRRMTLSGVMDVSDDGDMDKFLDGVVPPSMADDLHETWLEWMKQPWYPSRMEKWIQPTSID